MLPSSFLYYDTLDRKSQIELLPSNCSYQKPLLCYNHLMTSNIEQLKQSLKQVNAKYAGIKNVPPAERKAFGVKLNREKQKILDALDQALTAQTSAEVEPIDLTAPAAPNQPLPQLRRGTKHPLTTEIDRVVDIYSRMGFQIVESRQLDDEFHMFE